MSDQLDSIEKKIEKERIDNLFARSKTASFTLLIICTIYLVLLAQKFEWKPLLVWYLVLVAVLSGRWLAAILYASHLGERKSHEFWLYVFRLGVLAAGATVGSLNLFFFSEESLSFLLLAFIFPFGITAGAVTILLDFISFSLYVATLLGPVMIQTAFAGDQMYVGVGILTFVLTLFFLKFSKDYTNNFFITSRLRFENQSLLQKLEEEKNQVSNRLGRILNDSSIEIFVVNAASLQCLQVNRGAIENLCYTKEEFNDINILDIFTNLDRKSFDELLAPLYKGREVVVHKGANRRKDGSTYPVEVRLQLSAQDNPPIIVATVQNITERLEWEKKLIYQANFDQLTGLHNRHYIQAYMQSVFTRAKRQHKKVALLFMDLDNFKNINDTLGHDTGDELLRQTALRILTLVRESDIAARTGGDEFTVLLESLTNSDNAEVVASKLVQEFQHPFRIYGREIYTTISLGISIYPDDGDSLDQLMKYADMAMYQAKNNGRNNYCFFSHEMRRSSEEQMMISNHLRHAIAKEELAIFYQPKVDIKKSRIIGAEALLRWHNDELGDISPEVFIPLAEHSGLINELGIWVLERACREAMVWQGLCDEMLQVSVNISPQQFRSGILLESVGSSLKSSGLPPELLELEITESLLLQDSDEPLTILQELHHKGVRLALDDFGTGYSSLSYLRRFPLQVLKIDRSFISGLHADQSSKVLVDAIIAMAHSLDLEIVAEGVEHEDELEFLRQREVNIVQGYFLSPPMPVEKFRELLLDTGQSSSDKG